MQFFLLCCRERARYNPNAACVRCIPSGGRSSTFRALGARSPRPLTMPELDFLPSWPPALNPPLLIGIMLLAGVLGGEIARRFLALPRITGYVSVGIALGVSGLGWLRPDEVGAGRILLDVPLGIILFELGRRVDVQWLRRDKWLALTS